MNLIKQDVGVWMEVSKGYFPTEIGNYHVRWHMKESTDIDVRPWNNTEVSKNNWKGNVHEWLKPIKQVYVLTQDELEYFYNNAYTEGLSHIDRNGKTFKEFVNSITQ